MATIARVRTVFTGLAGLPGYSNLYFKPVVSNDALAAHAAVTALWQSLDGALNAGLTWTCEGDIALIEDSSGLQIAEVTTDTTTGVGGSGANSLPFATMGLMRFRTSDFIGGRQVRGRCYVPGFVEEESVGGLPTAATLTAMSTAFGAISDVANAPHVVWSRTHGQSFEVTSYSPWNQWAVLRSRRD